MSPCYARHTLCRPTQPQTSSLLCIIMMGKAEALQWMRKGYVAVSLSQKGLIAERLQNKEIHKVNQNNVDGVLLTLLSTVRFNLTDIRICPRC